MPGYDLSSVGSCVQLMLDQKDIDNRRVVFNSIIKPHDEKVAAQVLAELHKIAKDGKTGRERLMEVKEGLK